MTGIPVTTGPVGAAPAGAPFTSAKKIDNVLVRWQPERFNQGTLELVRLTGLRTTGRAAVLRGRVLENDELGAREGELADIRLETARRGATPPGAETVESIHFEVRIDTLPEETDPTAGWIPAGGLTVPSSTGSGRKMQAHKVRRIRLVVTTSSRRFAASAPMCFTHSNFDPPPAGGPAPERFILADGHSMKAHELASAAAAATPAGTGDETRALYARCLEAAHDALGQSTPDASPPALEADWASRLRASTLDTETGHSEAAPAARRRRHGAALTAKQRESAAKLLDDMINIFTNAAAWSAKPGSFNLRDEEVSATSSEAVAFSLRSALELALSRRNESKTQSRIPLITAVLDTVQAVTAMTGHETLDDWNARRGTSAAAVRATLKDAAAELRQRMPTPRMT